MKNPITDIPELRGRTELIQFLSDTGFDLTITSGQFEFIDHYLRLNVDPLRNNFLDAFLQNLSYRITPTNNYYVIKSGVEQLVYLLIHLKKKSATLAGLNLPAKLDRCCKLITTFIGKQEFKGLYVERLKITYTRLNRLDNLFRKRYKEEMQAVVNSVYELDAYISLAKVAVQKSLVLATYSDSAMSSFSVEKFYHPLLSNAVPYSIELNSEANLCFLTGPNMAGKSTFLKSVGLAMYLAHIGFPVPAKRMVTTIYHGIVTTINLSDDINLGYSHFYSEVHRIRETALKIKEKGRLFVIFDELFRGTNVKDAFDASLLIIRLFANIHGCTFFISTHLTEVAEKLGDLSNVQFRFFDSSLVNNTPVYEYVLRTGISHERLGLYIIKNEKIIDILESIIQE
jgi:DNA mismatch repair ATPase MutS